MRFFRNFLCVFFVGTLSLFTVQAQDDQSPFSCFNAFEIHFPLGKNDFSRSEIQMDSRKMTAVYYLYQDKYTFWYKFIVHEEVRIDFSVSPSNAKDRYRAMVFNYGGDDFCDRYVNRTIDPVEAERSPIFGEDGRITYRNTINAAPGDTFYISVFSLNSGDCGHLFHAESDGISLTMHAVHQPCYNFVYLEAPDFTQAKIPLTDISLELFDFQEDGEAEEESATTDTTPKNPKEEEEESRTGYGSITSIEVESDNEHMVNVGDRLILNGVYFYNNTYAFKPGADRELDQLVEFMRMNPTLEIEIQGHSANNTEDIRPDPNFRGQGKAWNFKGSAFELSEMRAQAVRDYMLEKGISKKRLSAKGYGDTMKRVPDAQTFEEFEKNMRVEALVIKQ